MHQEPDHFIYLDNNATTATETAVLAAMLPWFDLRYGNPSSPHQFGHSVRAEVDAARQSIATLLGAERDEEVLFTSGGSESNNTAILSALEVMKGRREIVVSATEHASLLSLCSWLEASGRARVHIIPVDQCGVIDREAFRNALSKDTAVASVQWVNNETGVIQPVEELAEMAHQVGALFHCDAVQGVGRLRMHLQSTAIDMLSASAHKLHGPKGIGALYLRRGTPFHPLIRGGHQQRGRRAGTENVPAIIGFGVAAELAEKSITEDALRLQGMRDRLQEQILSLVPEALVPGTAAPRVPNTLCVAFPDVEGEDLVQILDQQGIAVSSGSACTSGMMEPSHVLRAMRVPVTHLFGAIRISLSRQTVPEEPDALMRILPTALKQIATTPVMEEVIHG